ncbi:MAG: hypothetical protein M1816_004753 [Peltula sp. TS41687]|nr:MAG: hypothetical protein M1816_004753 [Peltula sp. TS41687]
MYEMKSARHRRRQVPNTDFDEAPRPAIESSASGAAIERAGPRTVNVVDRPNPASSKRDAPSANGTHVPVAGQDFEDIPSRSALHYRHPERDNVTEVPRPGPEKDQAAVAARSMQSNPFASTESNDQVPRAVEEDRQRTPTSSPRGFQSPLGHGAYESYESFGGMLGGMRRDNVTELPRPGSGNDQVATARSVQPTVASTESHHQVPRAVDEDRQRTPKSSPRDSQTVRHGAYESFRGDRVVMPSAAIQLPERERGNVAELSRPGAGKDQANTLSTAPVKQQQKRRLWCCMG